jgi:2-dehydropantoate 2-reductase
VRVAIIGAGGVGGYFGARLAVAGNDVVFFARGAHGAAIRENGLRVESGLGALDVPAKTSDDPVAIGPVDVVLFTVKLWDTEEAAHLIPPLLRDDTAVISLQNGVTKDEMLRKAVPSRALVGGVTFIAATIERPGVIRHTGTMQRIVVGEYDGSASPRLERFAAACRDAAIDIVRSDDIERQIWEKFVLIVGLSGATSAIRKPIGPIRENPRARALLHALLKEAVAVGRARGVALDPGYADDRLAFCDTLPAGMTSSMHGDLERGQRLEMPWLQGAVVRLGDAAGIDTPANRFVEEVLAIYAEGSPEPIATPGR